VQYGARVGGDRTKRHGPESPRFRFFPFATKNASAASVDGFPSGFSVGRSRAGFLRTNFPIFDSFVIEAWWIFPSGRAEMSGVAEGSLC